MKTEIIVIMKRNSFKYFKKFFHESRMLMSTKSKKPPSHYDVLKISPNSTQNTIKTAYYKLTKEYHPDKNTSLEAKTMFQSVSNAYEVLSNNKTRKQYDLQLLARESGKPDSAQVKSQDSPTKEPSQSKSRNIHYEKYIDGWTRDNYARSLRRAQYTKIYQKDVVNELHKIEREQEQVEKNANKLILLTATCCVMLATFIFSMENSKDKDIKRRKNSRD